MSILAVIKRAASAQHAACLLCLCFFGGVVVIVVCFVNYRFDTGVAHAVAIEEICPCVRNISL